MRFDRLDALRGLALVWMAIFHFSFDLANQGLIQADFYRDPWWTTQRTLILSTFLLCAGAGQAIATAQGQTWRRFWRRWAQVAGCAVLVTAGSALMFPRSFIYFGVLHGMAVMLLIARLTAHWKAWLWPLGALAVALPQLVQHPFFDSRWTNWVGLVTAKPITEDYVPLLPWLGVMWWGLAGTQWLLAHRPTWLSAGAAQPASASAEILPAGRTGAPSVARISPAVKPGTPLPASRRASPGFNGLALLGRWSLTFYMVHQPVLLGGLFAWQHLARA